MKLNNKGFSAVEGLLIIVIIAIIGGTGFYVYHANKNTDDTLNSTGQSGVPKFKKKSATTTPATTKDETSDWKAYTGTYYSFKYPSTWTLNDCGEGTVLLGTDAASAGHCQSDAIPEITIVADKSDAAADYKLQSPYKDITSKSVTVAGVSATRETGTYVAGDTAGIGPADGTKAINYLITGTFASKHARFYLLYGQAPSEKDVSSDFETLVNKTFTLK